MDTGNLIFGALILVIWLLFCSIIGAIAQRKGRSFWLWSFGPTLMILGIGLLGTIMIGFDDWRAAFAFAIMYPPIIIWIGFLIAILIAGKTYKKRMQEVAEEESIRQNVARQYNGPQQPVEPPRQTNPTGKTINDLYKRN